MDESKFIRAVFIRFVIVIGIIFAVLIYAGSEGCGPNIPDKINVDVSGNVNVHFNVTIETLQDYFTKECIKSLGISASQTDIAACAQNSVNNFSSFFSGLSK